MVPRPYSPDTAAFVASSLEAWDKFLSAGDCPSDVEHQNPSTSDDPDSFTDDSLDDADLSVLPSMPPQTDQTYERLASVMNSSYLELADLDVIRLEAIVDEVYQLLRDAILTGYSRRWDEFDRWLDFGHRLSNVLLAKKASATPREEEYDADVDSEELSDYEEEDSHITLVEIADDPVDEEFIRELYSRGLKELLDWDDLGY